MNNQWTASWTAARVHTCEAQLAEAKARAFASVLLTASGSGYPPHGTGSEIYDYYKHLLDIRRPDLLRRSRGAAAAALDVRRDRAFRLDDAGGFLPADERVDRRALPDRHGLLFLGARLDGRGGVRLGLPAYGRTGRRRAGKGGRRGRSSTAATRTFPISRSAVSTLFFAQAIWKYDEHCRALFLSGI